MGITPNFTQADVKARFDKFIAVIQKRQIQRLQRLGEDCVINAKANRLYEDQTSNLISSIGYTVFVNGIALHGKYEQQSPKNAKSGVEYDGAKKGEELAKKVGSKYTNGICLVVVAGMNYAVHVESMGLNVLTSAELFAKQEMPKVVAALKRNINKALS